MTKEKIDLFWPKTPRNVKIPIFFQEEPHIQDGHHSVIIINFGDMRQLFGNIEFVEV